MTNKLQLREQMRKERQALDFQWLEKSSQALEKHLQALEEFRSAETIGIYMPLPGEPDLRSLLPGKHSFCVPVYDKDSGLYIMAGFTEQTGFHTGHYGIQEPVDFAEVERDEIDLFIVPGMAFDPLGNRLGRGGGYYDRLLDGFQGICIGVAFEFQMIPQVPHLPHDKRMHIIVTEKQIIKVCDEHSTKPAV